MRAYLSVLGTNAGNVPIDSRTGIYRNPDGSHAIYARTGKKEHDLGVKDVTVSRLKDDTPPVIIEPYQSYIEVQNKQNTNGVTVVSDGDYTELDEGLTTKVDETAKISVGYQTEFRLSIEREAKTEINVGGDVGGDVVAGDKQRVDNRNQVIDSVMNRSEIGGDGGNQVEDSVVNRSTIGNPSEDDDTDSDTQNYCDTHERMYTAEVCPDCVADHLSRTEPPRETKFCMFCGSDIPTVAAVCPSCGEHLPDKE